MFRWSESPYRITPNLDQLFHDQTEEKIRSFLNLQRGWHLGEGLAPNTQTIEQALELNAFGRYFSLKTDAFPGIDGSVILTFYALTDCIELTVNPDSSIDLSHERGLGFNYELIQYLEQASYKEIGNHLKSLMEIVKCSPESLRKTFSTEIWGGSEVDVSPQQVSTNEYQYLMSSVSQEYTIQLDVST